MDPDRHGVIVCYPSADIPKVWPEIRPFIQRALERGSTWSIEQVYCALATAKAQCWTWQDPEIKAVLTTVIQPPECLLLTLGGENINDCRWALWHIEQFASDNQCDRLKIHGRKGWTKYGFTVVARDGDLFEMERKLCLADRAT